MRLPYNPGKPPRENGDITTTPITISSIMLLTCHIYLGRLAAMVKVGIFNKGIKIARISFHDKVKAMGYLAVSNSTMVCTSWIAM
jgi:hypothetical protein